MSLLEVNSVTKKFGGLVAINDVSLNIDEGEIVGLIGPNGAGKTTMFNLITGFYRPDSGSIKFMGEDITGRKPSEICKKGIARTFQLIKPFLNMTVFDNILCGALCRTNSVDVAKKEALKIIEWMGIDKKRNALTRSLTLAERKLVEVGRALATKPKLLLLDEVAAGLNPVETEETIKLIRKLRDTGITLCLVEHVMKAVMTVSDRIIVLDHGSKIAEGTPKEVSQNTNVIEAYLGRSYA